MSESTDRRLRRTRGTSRNAIDAKIKLERGKPAGQHEQVLFPDKEIVRAAVLQGMCPCCGLGPFTLLARHTNAQHGIDTRELRDLAGLTYTESITPPDFQEKRRGIALALIADGRLKPERPIASRPPQLSEAGYEARKRKPVGPPPSCVHCGGRARRRLPGVDDEGGATRGAWLRTCSDECAAARIAAGYAARTKPRPPCAVCGGPIPKGRSKPGTVKTCSDQCRAKRRQEATSMARERDTLALHEEAARRAGFASWGHAIEETRGMSSKDAGALFGVGKSTVLRWRERFA